MPKSTQKKKKNDKDHLGHQVERVITEIRKLTAQASDRYDKLDPETRKKLVMGVGALAALLAGAALIKKAKRDK